MNIIQQIETHVQALETAARISVANLPARVLATLKADPLVSLTIFTVSAVIGVILKAIF